jgi:methionyl-tRNA formyltransferase
MEKFFRCVVFASSEHQQTVKEAIDTIGNRMLICRVFTLDRNSQSIDFLKEEILGLSNIDFVFNYLSPKKFPKWLIDFPKHGCYNFHPASSAYPGVGSSSYAIYNQDENFKVTAHRMDEEFDRGDIVHELSARIEPSWSCFDLFNAALAKCKPLLDQTVDLLLSNSFPPKIKDWESTAKTRLEFEQFMIFRPGNDPRDLARLCRAVVHPTLPGPYVLIQGHYFEFKKPEF